MLELWVEVKGNAGADIILEIGGTTGCPSLDWSWGKGRCGLKNQYKD